LKCSKFTRGWALWHSQIPVGLTKYSWSTSTIFGLTWLGVVKLLPGPYSSTP